MGLKCESWPNTGGFPLNDVPCLSKLTRHYFQRMPQKTMGLKELPDYSVFLFDQTKIYVMNFVLSNKILFDNTKKRSSLDAP